MVDREIVSGLSATLRRTLSFSKASASPRPAKQRFPILQTVFHQRDEMAEDSDVAMTEATNDSVADGVALRCVVVERVRPTVR